MKTNRLITRVVLLVSLISLFNDVASEMLYPIMPVFLRSIGFTIAWIGILEGVAEATAGLSKGYFGNLSDRMGRRLPFIQFGYVLSALAKPLMVLFVHPIWIFLVRTTDRLAKGIRTSARDAILSDEATPGTKGKVFGFHRALDTVGACIGPVLALLYLWIRPGDYKMLFVIAFVPGIIAVLLTFFIKEKRHDFKPTRGKGFFGYLGYWKRASREYKLLVIGLLFFALMNSSDAFLLLALKQAGFSDTYMVGFYIFYNLAFALLAFPAGMLADRVGLRSIVVVGLIIFGVVYSLMGFIHGLVGFGILFFFYGFYSASTEGISKAWITNLAEKNEIATAIGFYTSMLSISTLISSSMAGLLWVIFGMKAMFLISGIGALLAAVYLTAIPLKKLHAQKA
ncbi:MAG: MFS transporter [Bacteroidota bacterium]|nr:MFS transporter [Bacteroidota bacterium]